MTRRRAEVAVLIFPGLTGDAYRVPVEDGGGEEQGAAVLAAVEAVAQLDAPWLTTRRHPPRSAQAAARRLPHFLLLRHHA